MPVMFSTRILYFSNYRFFFYYLFLTRRDVGELDLDCNKNDRSNNIHIATTDRVGILIKLVHVLN